MARWTNVKTPTPTTVNLNLICKDDPVRYAGRWFKVQRLVKVDGVVYIEGVTYDGEPVKGPASECTGCWNPLHKCFGRKDRNDRKRFWESIKCKS